MGDSPCAFRTTTPPVIVFEMKPRNSPSIVLMVLVEFRNTRGRAKKKTAAAKA